MIDQTEAVMDEKMRKAMEEAIEKFNGAFASKAGFQFGVEWCLEYLGKAAVTIIVGLALAPFFLVVAFVFWLMDRK